MYKTKRRVIYFIINVAVLLLSVIVSILIVLKGSDSRSIFVYFGIPAVIFLSFLVAGSSIRHHADNFLRVKNLESGYTAYINKFIDALRFCYSFDDFYKQISEILELQADCAVLFIDREKNYVLYNSPDRISSYYTTRDVLSNNFPAGWKDGFYYLGNKYGIVSSYRQARGFFICYQGKQFFVFNRYTMLFDTEIYSKLTEEFFRFIERTKIISNLSEISSLTKEWEQLADTQVSFLPHDIPNIPHLKIATYYRPLVNVSGDYYSILPIDSSKTLLMLGDVSGKGLPAALIMGLVMNTVKIIENKEDLVALIQAVDSAIKGMHLQDKYTVLFLGIVDTEEMKIRYVNASMSDPIVLSRAPDGYRIKELTSSASVVGIIDMDDVHVNEMRLFRGDTILLATDGVSEVMDDNGVELGDTEEYLQTLKSSAAKQPQQFVEDIVDLIMRYNGDKRLHDDVTMMVAKVG